MPAIRGSGLPTQLGRLTTDFETLAAGQTRTLPSGPNAVYLGLYSVIQVYDPVLGFWRNMPRTTNGHVFLECDGQNQRIANLSGCMVGAVVTTAGTGYTSAPAVTASAGSSVWVAIVGGLVNTVQSVPSNAGSGYTIPPRLVISAPPVGGVQATGHVTLSAGVVNAITIDNQGAGYPSAPLATFVTDPNDTGTAIVPAGATVQGVANSMTLAITGAGTIAAVVCTNPGTPVTSLPTLAFSGGGGANAAATAIACFSVTGYTVGNGGSFHAGTFITSSGGFTAGTATHTNPAIEQGIIIPRPVKVVPTLAANAIVASATSAPLSIEDWGYGFQAVPTLVPVDGTGLATTAVTSLAATVGGQTDTIWVQPLTG